MTSFPAPLFVFYKGFCCLDGAGLSLVAGFLVDFLQIGLVRGRNWVDLRWSGVSSTQRGVDGWQRGLFGQETALERSRMSLQRAHNRLDRGRRMQVLDIFRPKGGAQSAVECGSLLPLFSASLLAMGRTDMSLKITAERFAGVKAPPLWNADRLFASRLAEKSGSRLPHSTARCASIHH